MTQATTVTPDFVIAHRRLVEQGVHPLKAARTLLHLSQPALADVVQVGIRTIARAEAGEPIGSHTRHRLAAYFGMDVCQFRVDTQVAPVPGLMQRYIPAEPDGISPLALATLMQHFGTLLQFLRLRSRVSQCDVAAFLALYGDQIDKYQYVDIEIGRRAPRFCRLAALYKALVRSGVEIRSEERDAYLLLARKKIESKVTHYEHVAAERWQCLSAELAAFDAGEPDTASSVSRSEVLL
jgi:transcriptional regulator with XRE-family HTH domain